MSKKNQDDITLDSIECLLTSITSIIKYPSSLESFTLSQIPLLPLFQCLLLEDESITVFVFNILNVVCVFDEKGYNEVYTTFKEFSQQQHDLFFFDLFVDLIKSNIENKKLISPIIEFINILVNINPTIETRVYV